MKENFQLYAVILSAVLFVVMGVFIVVFMNFYQKIQKLNRLQQEKMREDFEQELLRSQLEIQEITFNHVGREIHDNVGQALSVAKLYLSSMSNETLDATRKKMDQTKDILAKAIQDLRTLSRSLNSDSIHVAGFHKAIEAEILRIGESGVIQTSFESHGVSQPISPETETILFRMCQEILSNAIRHAQASQIKISLNWENERLKLLIEDNGKGFDTEKTTNTGQGLYNLKKRAGMINAQINIESKNNSGTKFVIDLIIKPIFKP